jgi:SAM-dependent methyltransferase
MTFHERFDVVFLGEVLCTARDPKEIIRRCFKALRADGYIAIAEGLIDEAQPAHAPGNALVLPLRLEFALQPAEFFTIGSLRSALRAAGFGVPRFVAAGGGFYFVVAKKPAGPAARRRLR